MQTVNQIQPTVQRTSGPVDYPNGLPHLNPFTRLMPDAHKIRALTAIFPAFTTKKARQVIKHWYVLVSPDKCALACFATDNQIIKQFFDLVQDDQKDDPRLHRSKIAFRHALCIHGLLY